jgi:hypothetical protein
VICITRRYLLGVDLAKTLDYTSFAIIEMEYQAVLKDYGYHLKGLDRIKGVDYPIIVELIKSTVSRLDTERSPDTEDGPHLCMDASGLGAPIRDYLKQSKIFDDAGTRGKRLYPVVFTGGEAARRDAVTGNYNISKTLIISNFLSLMQHRRFDYAPDLQALPLLEQEISSFKRHTSSSGHMGFDAEQGAHDDLICATCIPLIIAEWLYRKQPTGPLVFSGAKRTPPWKQSGSGASSRGGGDWFSEAAAHHGGNGANFVGGINHR